MNTVGVVGAGQMGSGIAQVAACSGMAVVIFDSNAEYLQRSLNGIKSRLSKLVSKGTITDSAASEIAQQIRATHSITELSAADIVIEAIIEDTSAKLLLFSELDQICFPQTILATNTSSISVTKLAAATKRPDRVIGMHFMHPVPVMSLVEVIRGLQTSNSTYDAILELVVKLGKKAVTAHRDYPGFIVNRILMPLINEAAFVLMEGIASAEEIDSAMKLGTNHPMGPLELADFVGLDTVLAICKVFHSELGDDKYRPCPLLIKYVEAGWLGKKAGKGFYPYT